MPTGDTQLLIAQLDALEAALRAEPATPATTQALHQCDRLRQAALQSHAEGLRFAAFTLTRLMQQPGANLADSTHAAAVGLRELLERGGHLR